MMGLVIKGKSETVPEVAIEKVLKLLFAGQKGRGMRVKLGSKVVWLFINGIFCSRPQDLISLFMALTFVRKSPVRVFLRNERTSHKSVDYRP